MGCIPASCHLLQRQTLPSKGASDQRVEAGDHESRPHLPRAVSPTSTIGGVRSFRLSASYLGGGSTSRSHTRPHEAGRNNYYHHHQDLGLIWLAQSSETLPPQFAQCWLVSNTLNTDTGEPDPRSQKATGTRSHGATQETQHRRRQATRTPERHRRAGQSRAPPDPAPRGQPPGGPSHRAPRTLR